MNKIMELILSGNKNIETIRNVIYFVDKNYNNKLDKIYFIDSETSIYDKNNEPIEHERNKLVRECTSKSIKIQSIIIKKEELHDKIPELLSEELSFYDKDNIIIDFTNGQKYITSILYASASLTKIKNLFFLTVAPNKFDVLPEKLGPNDYIIDIVSPIDNLYSIEKHVQFEIIYYRDKSEEIINAFKEYKFESRFLNNSLELNINNGIDNYFLGKYAESIGSFGQITEEISIELYNIIKNKIGVETKDTRKKNFNEYINLLKDVLQQIRTKVKDNKEEPDDSNIGMLVNVGEIIDLIRWYRNLSGHPYTILREKEDSKLILDNTFYLLKLIIRSGVLK